MKFHNYFLIKLKPSNMSKFNSFKTELDNIKMINEDDEMIVIMNRETFFTIDQTEQTIDFFIQNNSNVISERIDYLLDEDWTFEEININLFGNGKSIPYEILGYEQLTEFELEENNSLKTSFLKGSHIEETICILGPKPPGMYGYNMKDMRYFELIEKIIKELRPIIQKGKDVILTNGYIGAEVLGFDIAKMLKHEFPNITNVLAVPFLNLDGNWIDSFKDTYRKMVKEADLFIEIDKCEHYKYGTPEIYTKEKFIKKNDFDVDYASTFIVINDKQDTLRSVKNAIRFKGKELIEINI